MRLWIEPRRGSVRTARHWVRRHAEEADLPPDAVSLAELLTSEVVANAVLHGHGDVTVDLDIRDGVLTVAVSDEGDDLPVARSTGPEVPGGHGVRLVQRLATRWGVERQGAGGKTVWFTVTADGP